MHHFLWPSLMPPHLCDLLWPNTISFLPIWPAIIQHHFLFTFVTYHYPTPSPPYLCDLPWPNTISLSLWPTTTQHHLLLTYATCYDSTSSPPNVYKTYYNPTALLSPHKHTGLPPSMEQPLPPGGPMSDFPGLGGLGAPPVSEGSHFMTQPPDMLSLSQRSSPEGMIMTHGGQ